MNVTICSPEKKIVKETNCVICNCITYGYFDRRENSSKRKNLCSGRFYDPWGIGKGKVVCNFCKCCMGNLMNDPEDEENYLLSYDEALEIHKKNIGLLIEINDFCDILQKNDMHIDDYFDIIQEIDEVIKLEEIKNPDQIIEDPILKQILDTKFRINSKSIFLTYKHHLPFDDLINFINLMFPIQKHVICHEVGDENDPYYHTHAIIIFKKYINVFNCRKFDFEFNGKIVHPNFFTTRNTVASYEYLLKQFRKTKVKNWSSNFDVEKLLAETRNKYIKKLKKEAKKDPEPGDIAEQCTRIAGYKNPFEAIQKEARDLKDVMAINLIYNNKMSTVDKKQIDYLEGFGKTMRKWQKKLYEILIGEPDRRKVYWIVDVIGGQGKSDFCSYIDTLKKPETCLTIASTGSTKDIFDGIRNWMDEGRKPEIILIDLPRTFQDRDSIYTLVESIKNGRMTCTKYKGKTIKFYPPHLMVFANWMPETKFLSADRWVIMNLVAKKANDRRAKLVNVDINEINRKKNMDDFD